MRLASILLICSHASLDLPIREIFGQITGALQLGKSLRDRVLDQALIQGRFNEGKGGALGDGNCDATRRGKLGQWDGRGEEGKNGKDKGVCEVHVRLEAL